MRVGREEPETVAPVWKDFHMTFRRSRKGNLWRMYDGMTLTVFRRGDGAGYCWCAADSLGPRYSTEPYEERGGRRQGDLGCSLQDEAEP